MKKTKALYSRILRLPAGEEYSYFLYRRDGILFLHLRWKEGKRAIYDETLSCECYPEKDLCAFLKHCADSLTVPSFVPDLMEENLAE